MGSTIKSIESIIVDENTQIIKNYYKELLEKFNPVALISIERCGRNSSCQYLNMRRKDISEHTARLDELFLLMKGKALTIGIGDGGNEIGMGRLQKVINCELNENRKNEEKISPCIIPADYLVTATVSNWGAYGVIGYLQIFSGKALLPSFDEIKKYLKFLVSKGAVDGVKKKVSISVDGYGIGTIKTIVDKLHTVVAKTTANNCTMNSCYDSVSLSQKQIGSRIADKLVKYANSNHNKNYSILDIGCNTGELTNYINKKINNKDIFITGSDINTESSAIPDCTRNALKQRSKEFAFRKLFLEFSPKPATFAIFYHIFCKQKRKCFLYEHDKLYLQEEMLCSEKIKSNRGRLKSMYLPQKLNYENISMRMLYSYLFAVNLRKYLNSGPEISK